MNKTEDDELGNEELSDEEIRALSEGLFFYIRIIEQKHRENIFSFVCSSRIK